MSKNRPSFLWDYDLTPQEVKRNIKEGNEFTRNWLVSRILESANYDDIWKYLTLKELINIFPELKLKKPIKEAWQKAFKAWGIISTVNMKILTVLVHYIPYTFSFLSK